MHDSGVWQQAAKSFDDTATFVRSTSHLAVHLERFPWIPTKDDLERVP